MKKHLLSISFVIITLSVLVTLMNCGGDDTPVTPCVPPKPPTVKAGIKILVGQSIALTATDSNTTAIYRWTGPNGWTSTEQNPTIANATESMAGNYRCTVTVNGCTSVAGTTIVAIQGTIIDSRDHQEYKTIRIGTQTWMAQNLNWQPETYAADWKVYGDIPDNGTKYGTLYDFFLSQKAEKGFAGWRLPTNADWQVLVDFLGGYDVAGAKLKEAGTTHWNTPNAGTTNSSGFSAFGAGHYDKAITKAFVDLKDRTYYWTSTPYSVYMDIVILRFDDMWAHMGEYGDKQNYYSIRLVRAN
jgi:uncharacterized protein (TIGR02145 family)